MRRRLDTPAAPITLVPPNVVHLNSQKMPNTMRLIVAELALILLIDREVFIAAFAVPAVILPFADVALE